MRILSMVALLLVPALAGCLGDGLTELVDDVTNKDPAAGKTLRFLEPVDLLCPDHPNYGVYPSGEVGNCAGFGEPTLEVAGDGTIWYSAVCCVGQSPPIWLSHDGGLTFEALPFADGTGVVRDAFGIEGDFAIDDAGNVYFFDISAATAYFTKYEADGTHVHTKPDTFAPLVDRPWVRAGVEDEVWIFYNTGSSTVLHHSTDGGLTWDFPLGGTTFDCALMTFAQGPNRDDLVVSGCSGSPSAWISHDGGVSFRGPFRLPLPEGESATEQYMQPSMDAAGNAYVPVTHTWHPEGDDGPVHEVISIYRIEPDGSVVGPFTVTPRDGLVDKPWSIAGGDGVFAMAYYHADDVARANEPGAVWHLKITYSLNADLAVPDWHTVVADPDPVLEGNFGRSLGDFLQLRQAENGDLVVAYAENHGSLQNKFVRSQSIDFGPEVFRNGPQP